MSLVRPSRPQSLGADVSTPRRVRHFGGPIREIVLHPPLHRPQRAQKSPESPGLFSSPKCLFHLVFFVWRRDPESNRTRRICNPLHNRFAIAPLPAEQAAILPAAQAPFSGKKKGSRSFPVFEIWSGIRGSNSRPIPWQGIALPTELIPRVLLTPYLKPRHCLDQSWFRLWQAPHSMTARTALARPQRQPTSAAARLLQ